MAHGRDKPGREKKKPKKDKLSTAKPGARETEVIQHISQHGQEQDSRH